MDAEVKAIIRQMHNAEATDECIYRALAENLQGNNRDVLLRMAEDEKNHCAIWRSYINEEPVINRRKVFFYRMLGKLFGLTFVVHQLEIDETLAAGIYDKLTAHVPEAAALREDEERHESMLATLLQEDKLKYLGSMVLGLSDALVELTGALAGFTLALGDNLTTALAGFITGVAATLSMAASQYLSAKTSGDPHPLKSAIYTGIAYLITVAILLTPYFCFASPIPALLSCLAGAALIILTFTYFVAVVQKEAFKPKFLEMLGISFTVAAISFLIGWAARAWLGVDL